MKKILGLDLGTNSVGWAMVNEAENETEKSSIIKVGVRVNPLTVDEKSNFDKQKGISLNAARTLKRSMRRNLQRYKLRRSHLVNLLIKEGWINKNTILSEHGNRSTFETYRLRAKAVNEQVSLEEFARILLMINKKRGYKSSRKTNKGNEETGAIIDSIDVAKYLYDNQVTPGEYCLYMLQRGKKQLPDFYRSDLQAELDLIWSKQTSYYPDLFSSTLKQDIVGKNKSQTWAILAKNWAWTVPTNSGEIVLHLQGIKRSGKKDEQRIETYGWRVKALNEKLGLEELAIVLQEINGEILASSQYLGNISDRSKELVFQHLTVGQYLMQKLDADPNVSLKNLVFYRQDYLDEFETLWTKQAEFHKELTAELKREIRDIVIFYQRRLKSQKGLIGICELAQKEVSIVKNGKEKVITIGAKQIPKSSPLFQEFKVWHMLNNVVVSCNGVNKRKKKAADAGLFSGLDDFDPLYLNGSRALTLQEKQMLAKELTIKDKLSKSEALKLLFEDYKDLDLNFKELQGNTTGNLIYQAFARIIDVSGHLPINFKDSTDDILSEIHSIFSSLGWNEDILYFDSAKKLDSQSYYRLWHLLYSYEGDKSLTGDDALVKRLMELCHFDKEYATILASVKFESDYGNLSAKAITKLLPHLKAGLRYDEACANVGYKHSKSSLTKEEIENKVLKDKLSLLPKNSLRNPVVEKVLNQMVNVVNQLIETYGRPDEIRVELARELKKSADERRELTESLAKSTKEQAAYREILQKEFGFTHVSRNDIIRYRLYEELKANGYHTLYSDTYIPKEKLFSKEFDIEHIIPRARLFDDSYSNKTIELKSVNIEKGDKTAYDYVAQTRGESQLQQYIQRCESLFGSKSAKFRKLKMQEKDIPSGFIDRDLRNTQYISRKALSMLSEVCRCVVATTGSVTDQLRQDWQLVDLMKELNWDKYKAAGEVEYFTDHDGRVIGQINGWTKRNDHRHHAMDALTVAFTKPVFVQYFNNKNASSKPSSNEYAIKAKYVEDRKIIPPIPLHEFRVAAKEQLQSVLISLQTKNKVVTRNVNQTKSHAANNKCIQLTPRGQLHEETIYGRHLEYVTQEEKVNASFNEAKIQTVAKKAVREALLKRLAEYGNDPKKAFTGRNTLDKNPVWINFYKGIAVPVKVKTVTLQPVYTVRKPITENLSIDKVVDVRIKQILKERIAQYGSPKAAFANLEEDPIWLNQAKGIKLKSVTIKASCSELALREKKDKDGKIILGEDGHSISTDFICTGNNHHSAIYQKPMLDKMGNPMLDNDGNVRYELAEVIVSFFEAVARVTQGLPIIDRNYKRDEGWSLLVTLKQNEYFVFPNETTGFNPKEIDLTNPDNYPQVSQNLFRVQKFSSKYYVFRHHLETNVDDKKELQEITWKRICSLSPLSSIVKVRVNHIGQIVGVGEY
jgi:CRISPR-associated endonuclease Csn1